MSSAFFRWGNLRKPPPQGFSIPTRHYRHGPELLPQLSSTSSTSHLATLLVQRHRPPSNGRGRQTTSPLGQVQAGRGLAAASGENDRRRSLSGSRAFRIGRPTFLSIALVLATLIDESWGILTSRNCPPRRNSQNAESLYLRFFAQKLSTDRSLKSICWLRGGPGQFGL